MFWKQFHCYICKSAGVKLTHNKIMHIHREDCSTGYGTSEWFCSYYVFLSFSYFSLICYMLKYDDVKC